MFNNVDRRVAVTYDVLSRASRVTTPGTGARLRAYAVGQRLWLSTLAGGHRATALYVVRR